MKNLSKKSNLFSITKTSNPTPPVINDITLGTTVKSKVFGIQGEVENILFGTSSEPFVTIKSVYLENGVSTEEETMVSIQDCVVVSHQHEAKYLQTYQAINDCDFSFSIGVKVKDKSNDNIGYIVAISISHLTSPIVSVHRDLKKVSKGQLIGVASIHDLELIDKGVSERFEDNLKSYAANLINFKIGDEVAFIATPDISGVVTEVNIRAYNDKTLFFRTKKDGNNQSTVLSGHFTEIMLVNPVPKSDKPNKKTGCMISRHSKDVISSSIQRFN